MGQKIYALLFAAFLLFGFAACSSQKFVNGQTADTVRAVKTEEIPDTASLEDVSAETGTRSEEGYDGPQSTPQEEDKVDQKQFYIMVGETIFTAAFCDNSSAEAFRELLAESPLTIEMHDYGNFEKVGEIGSTLPSNDERITTEPGDVILYLGTSITIYYDINSWNFTRLGKIYDVTKEELLAAFGDGDVTVTFSIEIPE